MKSASLLAPQPCIFSDFRFPLSSFRLSILFDDHAVILPSAFAGNEAADDIALDEFNRAQPGVAVAAAAAGGHAHALARLQRAILGFVEQLGFGFAILEDQHLARLPGLGALDAPRRAA